MSRIKGEKYKNKTNLTKKQARTLGKIFEKAIREDKGFSVNRVADEIDVSWGTLHNLIKGKTVAPPLSLVMKTAGFLGLSLNEICEKLEKVEG